MNPPKTLILGIGNAIRGDDAIGLLLARELAKDPPPETTVRELETSGFEILDTIAGFSTVIIIDAMRAKKDDSVGEVICAPLDASHPTATLLPSHGFDFSQLIQTWRRAHPERIPADIFFILIKAADVDEFREGLSRPLQMKFAQILDDVRAEIKNLLRLD
ncbi:MAG TPA: hydrogenase maturation protease [Candidatus Sumerlaeota bacterium]|nr:MAG: hydrogenase 2 maturation endopeptidase [candidate division BRC1 bacterium ADurb.Bin183]HQH11439.1 hydrogenase maturation protease [Candidatus Sumerlaeota bacterium]